MRFFRAEVQRIINMAVIGAVVGDSRFRSAGATASVRKRAPGYLSASLLP